MSGAADILVAGALHLDVVVTAPRLPRLDETLPGTSVAYPLGGKAGNQAMAAARMGARVALAGRVGTDAAGPRLISALDEGGVDRTQVRTVAGESGMSVAIVTEGGGYGAVIVPGVNRTIDAGEIVVEHGTRLLLLQNEIAETVNLSLARRARETGARVVLNAAPARAVPAELLGLTDILVVNRVEAADLTGQDAEGLAAEAAARALRRLGPKAVIVTLGGDGLVLAEGAGTERAPAFAVTVVSTHGAGDAFIGALAAGLVRGAGLADAARFAQGAAALTVAAAPEARLGIDQHAVRRFLPE
ncbi:MAG: PfkB family carbohydrate kinase [Pseudomonadota bacterium]